MSHRLLFPVFLSLLGSAALSGCGSPSTGGGGSGGTGGSAPTTTTSAAGGQGGTGASGGSGATGGAGSGGGTTGDTTAGSGGAGGATTTNSCSTTWSCPPECTAAELDFGSSGFSLYSPDSSLFDTYGPMTLTAVSESGFELLAPTGEKVVLGWAGSDPTPYFAVGDVVETHKEKLPGGKKWSWIERNGVVAASWAGSEWGTVVNVPGVPPFGGPSFNVAYQCVQTGVSCLDHVYSLQVYLGEEQAVAGTKQTVQVGDYEVHNPGIHAVDCEGEDSVIAGFTLLGPAAPP